MEENDVQSQEALNEPQAQEPVEQPSPAVEDQPVAQEASDEAPEPSEKPNRAQRRISDLSKQLKEAQAERERLEAEAQARAFFSQQPQTTQDNSWKQVEELAERGELTVDQLKQIIDQSAESKAEFKAKLETEKLRQELAQKEFWGAMEKDVREIESTNPIFNPASPEFDAEYVEELTQLYTEAYGKDTQSLMKAPKLSTFVSRIEKLRVKAEEKGVVRSSAQLAEQAAQGAVIGTGGATNSRGGSKEALKQKGMQTGDFKDYFKTMASE